MNDKTTEEMLMAIRAATEALARGDKSAAVASLSVVTTGAPSTPPPPPELLARCESADAEVESAKTLLEEAMKKRSDCAKVLLDKYGAGPFLVRGQWVTVIARAYAEGEKPTYFFRAMRGSGVHAAPQAPNGAKPKAPTKRAM